MLLINPAMDPATQPDVFKPFLQSSFPTAIGYLAGYLREKHNDNSIIHDEQMSLLSERQLRDRIERIKGPKIVGLTCLTATAKRAYELTHLIKKIDREIVVVLGGIHATAIPEECLERSSADIVVRGEGEEAMSEIYAAVQQKEHFKEIKGIMTGENDPDYTTAVTILTKSAIKEMIVPSLLPIIIPIGCILWFAFSK